MEEDTSKIAEDNKKESKPRCRMKKLLNNIQELMDFYFSDVNLNHDRFLRKEVEKDTDRYVDLSTMLKFNKLKQLTLDITILAKAVENSLCLELNDARTKVRRKEKLPQLENVDSRTVYVEEFPANTDHDWLKSVFTTCGTVNYISLPKYKHNKQIKGFAFIEFSTPEEAYKACQVLNTIQCKNKKRLSTTSNNGDNSAKKRRKRRSRSESGENNGGSLLRQNSKRRRSVSESSEGSPVKTNRRRRQSSFCSIDENEVENNSSNDANVNIEHGGVDKKFVDTTTLTCLSRKKKRSRSRSMSSDGECRYVKIKNHPPKTVIEKANTTILTTKEVKSDHAGLQPNEGTENTSATKTTSRKRKASNSKENEMRKEKLVITSQHSTSQSELKSENNSKDSSNDAVFTCHDVVGDSHDRTEVCTNVGNSTVVSCANSTDSQNKGDSSLDNKQSGEDTSKNLTDSSSTETNSNERKRKTSDKEEENLDKKMKLEQSNLVPKEKPSDDKSEEHVKEDECADIKEEKKKKKNRQHKKKGDKNSNETPKIPPLHVISKCEWLTLKKEYKRLQHIKMSELKRNLKVLKIEQVRREELKDRIFKSIAAKTETTDVIKDDVDIDKNDFEKEKENYESSPVVACVEDKNDTKSKGLELTSGTVVALKTSSENLTRKDIKSTLSSFGEVAYVDYVDGVYQGFVRFASTGDAEKVMSLDDTEKQTWVFQLTKLPNEEENEYFHKAEEKRLQKYDKAQRKKRKKGRGVDKITRDMEEAANHIHFS